MKSWLKTLKTFRPAISAMEGKAETEEIFVGNVQCGYLRADLLAEVRVTLAGERSRNFLMWVGSLYPV